MVGMGFRESALGRGQAHVFPEISGTMFEVVSERDRVWTSALLD